MNSLCRGRTRGWTRAGKEQSLSGAAIAFLPEPDYKTRPSRTLVARGPTTNARCQPCFPSSLHLRNLPQSPNRRPSRSGSRCPGESRQLTITVKQQLGPSFAAPLTYETVHAPPATVFWHPLHFQMPTECRFTVFFPQKVQVYLACCVISIFLTCFRREAPYLCDRSGLPLRNGFKAGSTHHT